MFVEGATVTLIVFAWLFLRWTREAELRQSLLDARARDRSPPPRRPLRPPQAGAE